MRILIISPTYNEIKGIQDLISQVFNINLDINLLIIDDNSPDGTANLVKSLFSKYDKLHLIERASKLGLGTAYIDGFKWALKNNYDIVIQMDADLSHNPKDIVRLVDEASKYDLVIGSRYINGVNVINWPISRLILSYSANIYARFLIGIKINDLTGGYKCFNSKVLKNINFSRVRSEGYSFQIEMTFLAWINNFSIKEIPIVFTDRTVGESKMNKGIIFEAIFIVPKLLFKKIFRR